jgi:hypothetical protein
MFLLTSPLRVTRSARDTRFKFKATPAGPTVPPKNWLAFRNDLELNDKITQHLEDGDLVYRGEVSVSNFFEVLSLKRI